MGGNIGAPLLDKLDEIAPGEPIVLELSSFQLELYDPALAWGPVDGIGPDIAAILNVTPNHLDRHPSMAAYAAAKLNFLRRMPAGSTVILSADDPATAHLAHAVPESLAPPSSSSPAEWDLGPLLDEVGESLQCRGRQSATVQPPRRRCRAAHGWKERRLCTTARSSATSARSGCAAITT